MPLVKKHRMSERKLAANRLNGPHSRGAVTPEGKARAAAASLRHGYYSKSAEVALTALGEDPAEFKRRLESLIDFYAPANALEMGLVMQLARALWRMERFNRVAESLAVNHLEKMQEAKKQVAVLTRQPFFVKLEHLTELCDATCLDQGVIVGPTEMNLFEIACHDVPEKTAKEILRLLLRLRKPGTTADLGPEVELLVDDEEVPVAEGEEREAARRGLLGILSPEINSLKEHIMRLVEEPDQAQAQFDRDKMLADAQPKAALMNQGEESSLRQVLRITKLLMNIKRLARPQEKIENAECSQDVIENKGSQNGQNTACQDVHENK